MLPAHHLDHHQPTSLHDTVVRARLFAVATAASSLARHSLQMNVLSPSTSAGFRDKHSRWYLRPRGPHSQHAIPETGGQARCTPLLAPFALDHAQVGVVWLRFRTGSDPLPDFVAQGQDKRAHHVTHTVHWNLVGFERSCFSLIVQGCRLESSVSGYILSRWFAL